jgi:hypothetical protein
MPVRKLAPLSLSMPKLRLATLPPNASRCSAEKPACPLRIGQRVRIRSSQALKLRTRCDLKRQRLHELPIVTLQDAEQRRDSLGIACNSRPA